VTPTRRLLDGAESNDEDEEGFDGVHGGGEAMSREEVKARERKLLRGSIKMPRKPQS